MSTQAGQTSEFARLWTAECSRNDPDSGEENKQWFKLRVGSSLGRFIFKVNRADFLRCPRLLAGFDGHFANLEARTHNGQASDPLADDDADDDCLAWIMPTLYTTLRDRGELFDQSERHRKYTLKEFWQMPFRVFRVSCEHGRMCFEYGGLETSPNMATWTGLPLPHLQDVGPLRGIKIIPWSILHVCHNEPEDIVDDQPRAVWMSDHQFYLKSFEGLDKAGVARLVAKYETIDAKVFKEFEYPPTTTNPLRVPRTFYLVVDDEKRALGLVQTYVDGGVPLREALQSSGDAAYSDATKRAWKRDLVQTLAQLHKYRILWERVSLDSVLVSGENAWIFHFGARPSHQQLGLTDAEMTEADIALLAGLFDDELWQWTESQRVAPTPYQRRIARSRPRRSM